MKTGVYVGSFDPVHKGHINLVKQLLNRRIVNQVVMVATGSYWQKALDASLTDRIAMLELYHSRRIIIDKENNNCQYTYQVMNQLHQQHPDWDLYLIIGDDLIPEFNKWQNLDELLKYKVIVINRCDINVSVYLDKYPDKQQFIIVKDFVKFDISSSQVRTMIKDGRAAELTKYLDHGTVNYLRDHHLYQG
ncbi:MAG: nicotinate-nicotinamide nucleotide adenylyltransferase [Erysipelotrichaceae bacterium]|nr:nicotinate-nicotinamide nucleotide adenylyltransferase [Erysipelotrichaceae bacterium]